jgi:UDP-galactopyranose mutase
MPKRPDLIVFSHLRWNFVYQRPQHLLSRIARKRRVWFVEEPIHDAGLPPHWERMTAEPGVTVLRPHTPVSMNGFSNNQMPHVKSLMRQLLQEEGIIHHDVWFYTPMALPLLDDLSPQVIAYDCMDELSAFLNAPAELIEAEDRLFEIADVVFTGGPSLYRAKKDRHKNVHCFPSSVDTEHFSRGASAEAEPEDQAGLPHPRLGYFGVIDERLDMQLLGAMAVAHPEWQIMMVGPVVKIDPRSLPDHPNIHYLGQRNYADLPGYLKGWDVCLLPFARNEATRFISPTKTLEYMAAEKLIVSTPIVDVAEPYGNIVYLADTAQSFIESCERALKEDQTERRRRLNESRLVISKTSWDRTADAMETLLEKADRRNAVKRDDSRVVVIGAGPTGLSAAYHLGERALLVEQNDKVGGWCRSVTTNGFTFDYAGHIMFSSDPYVHQLYKLLLGDNVHWQDREAWIYSKNVYTRYPFQGALYGLPSDVIKECIVGAIEARFGALKGSHEGTRNGSANGHANGNGKTACPESISDCCADGILESSAKLVKSASGERAATGEPRNFEEFIYKVWGAGIARHFAIPYNRKLWAVPLDQMETSWLGGRVPLPNLEEMIEGALKPVPKPMGPNARFGYPLRGGFQALMDAFVPHLKGDLLLNSSVKSVSPGNRTVTLQDGTHHAYSQLISTMPLPKLISCIEGVPAAIRSASEKLRHISVRCVHLGIGRENLTEKHWIYYPEDTVFHRIFVQGNASPYCNPPGGFGLTCEITYSKDKPLPCEGEALIERCTEDCRRVGIIGVDDPVWAATQCDLPHAYVIYNHARKEAVEVIREWLEAKGIYLAGRYSEWEYYNSDHAFLAGKKAAETVLQMEANGLQVAPVVYPGTSIQELSNRNGD